MNTLKRLSQIYKSAAEIAFDDSSRIVFFSDCHRGDGSFADNFSKNQNLFFSALTHYYNEDYTYIELGDGDELWENRKLSEIVFEHSDAFWLMSRFYNEGRLYMIYGNHDIVKRKNKFVQKNLYEYFDERIKKNVPLFKNICLHEGLVLKHAFTGAKIFLLHGHQVDFLNDTLWKLSRFLVRYLWKPLESVGFNNPTSTARNHKRKEMVEKKLIQWVKKENCMLIAGHTHRPMFPDVNEPPYFNDGSCVHPRCITAIEIADGDIMLIKWSVKTRNDGTLYVGRDILAGPQRLRNYLKQGRFGVRIWL